MKPTVFYTFLILAINQVKAQTYPLNFSPEIYGKVGIKVPCLIEELKFKSPIVLRCEDHESDEADQDRKIFEGLAQEGAIAYGDEDTEVENPSDYHFGFDSEIKDYFQTMLTEAEVQRKLLDGKKTRSEEREAYEKELMISYLPDFFLLAQKSSFFIQILDGIKQEPKYADLGPLIQRLKDILMDKGNSIIDVRNKIRDLKQEESFDFLTPLQLFRVFHFINTRYISQFTARILSGKSPDLDIIPKTMTELGKRIKMIEGRKMWEKIIDITTTPIFTETLLTEWRSLYFVKNTLMRYCHYSEEERPIFLQMGADHCQEVARMFQLVSKDIPVQITEAGSFSVLNMGGLGIQSKLGTKVPTCRTDLPKR